MSLLALFQWLEHTRASVAFRESLWAFPIIESVHVLGICLFVGISSMWDLRLMGVGFAHTHVSDAAERLLPWMKLGFAIMIVSGVVTFLNSPVRYYDNVFFRAKMVMLVLAGVNAWVFHRTVHKSISEWDMDPDPPRAAKIAGVTSLVLWALIITTGRMIAYNWFDKR